jgi:hypothetical protein
MKMIGTVLPTYESLASSDRYARMIEAEKKVVAKHSPVLAQCERRVVGGETRYYASERRYAIVGRNMRIQWFEVRLDGDYRV